MTQPDPVRQGYVLIVDDEPANVELLAAALEDTYELLFATNGARALEIAASRAIDLVLLDVAMPRMDGYEVCRRLKASENTKDVPVIFVSAMREMDDEMRGFDVGGVDYISKPISPARVRARVRTHIELKQARDLLSRLASIDPLTGIANRRRFDDSLEQAWRRAVRAGAPLSLMLVDVDAFKEFNDNYGHARGDDCLRAIAAALLAALRRPGDLVARYGGDEFGVVLEDTDAAGMRALIQRLLQGVRRLDIAHAHSPVQPRVTVTIGGACLQPPDDTPASHLLLTADKLLYEAKEQGRNCGVCGTGDNAHTVITAAGPDRSRKRGDT